MGSPVRMDDCPAFAVGNCLDGGVQHFIDQLCIGFCSN